MTKPGQFSVTINRKGPVWAFYDPRCAPERGKIRTSQCTQSIESHINGELSAAMNEIGFGITLEMIKPDKPSDYDDFA